MVPMPSSRTPSGEMFCGVTSVCWKVPYTPMYIAKVKITTRLFRTGVHIIAPNRPRALRIWPITTCTPMKKMVGRQ